MERRSETEALEVKLQRKSNQPQHQRGKLITKKLTKWTQNEGEVESRNDEHMSNSQKETLHETIEEQREKYRLKRLSPQKLGSRTSKLGEVSEKAKRLQEAGIERALRYRDSEREAEKMLQVREWADKQRKKRWKRTHTPTYQDLYQVVRDHRTERRPSLEKPFNSVEQNMARYDYKSCRFKNYNWRFLFLQLIPMFATLIPYLLVVHSSAFMYRKHEVKRNKDMFPIIIDGANPKQKAPSGATVKIKSTQNRHPLQDHDSEDELISHYSLVIPMCG